MHLAFDGSSTHRGGGAGILLPAPDDVDISLYFKLAFHCSNIEVECEALIIECKWELIGSVCKDISISLSSKLTESCT